MKEALLKQFVQLIDAHTGLQIREQDRNALGKKIEARMQALRITTPERYYQLLENSSGQAIQLGEILHEPEWKKLILLLTTGESYFFRDQGQFDLLKNQILPELIQQKSQPSSGTRRSLRIWSAGCSTGEEAYSLAILIHELLPNPEAWNICILGTDLNSESVEKARQGVYNSWSLRSLSADLQTRFFRPKKSDWELDAKIRRMVTFCQGNLVKDSYPQTMSGLHQMDLIICRNVFIYFGFEAIASVVKKFYHTLQPGGYLITGHAELYGQDLGLFQTRVFPASVIYQRQSDLPIKPNLAPPLVESPIYPTTLSGNLSLPEPSFPFPLGSTVQPAILPPLPSIPEPKVEVPKLQDVLYQAKKWLEAGEYLLAIREAEQTIKPYSAHFDAHYLIAQAYANLGNYQQANYHCHQAILANSLSESPYYLLAYISEEQGNVEAAKNYLKKIIYLAPSSIHAYLELGSLYERENDITIAAKMRATALELLKQQPPHSLVDKHHELTTTELVGHLEQLLKPQI